MFSGIVEEMGVLRQVSRKGGNVVLAVQARLVLDETDIGDSIAVNGVCLTVIGKTKDSLSFEAIPQTQRCTNLGGAQAGDRVNLERSLKAGDRISGHFVLGHVDAVGVIRKKGYEGGNQALAISFPAEYLKYAIPKGSVAVDGISLTIAACRSNLLSVYIIPHTMKNTTLGFKGPSDRVNLEFDILAKRR